MICKKIILTQICGETKLQSTTVAVDESRRKLALYRTMGRLLGKLARAVNSLSQRSDWAAKINIRNKYTVYQLDDLLFCSPSRSYRLYICQIWSNLVFSNRNRRKCLSNRVLVLSYIGQQDLVNVIVLGLHCQNNCNSHSATRSPWSAEQQLLVVPRSKLKRYGDHSFKGTQLRYR